jgi:uncharacterized membrane protein YbhN (UPF0104 family)
MGAAVKLGVLRWLIFPLGLAVCAWALQRYIGDLGARIAGMSWTPMAFAAFINLAYVLGYALIWHIVTRLFGASIPLRWALAVFFVSLAGKYLPLKVAGTVFRVAQYRSGFGAPLPGVLQSVYVEGVAFTAAGIVVIVALLPLVPAVAGLVGLNDFTRLALALAALAVCLLPTGQRLVFGGIARILRVEFDPSVAGTAAMAAVVLLYAGAWIALGSSLYLICLAVTPDPPAGLWELAVFAYAVAGLGGMLAFVLPSGIGVREGIMIAALSTALQPADAALAAVAARLIVTVAEFLLAAAGGAALAFGVRTAGIDLNATDAANDRRGGTL